MFLLVQYNIDVGVSAKFVAIELIVTLPFDFISTLVLFYLFVYFLLLDTGHIILLPLQNEIFFNQTYTKIL